MAARMIGWGCMRIARTSARRRYDARRTLRLLLPLALLTAGGCVSPPRNLGAPERYDHGLVLVLPGIEGRSIWNRDIALGLDAGGVSSAIEIWDWTYGPAALVYNLVSRERNEQEAQRLADHVEAYRAQYPARPVHMIGHSGGGGIAVLALECLPAERPIELALLLAPALSPQYDLSTALQRTRGGIYNFYSHKDVTLLKVGTSVFGSIDRARGEAAGAVGFVMPPEAGPQTQALYRNALRQIGWTPRLLRFGADGSHVGWTSQRFARRYLAPLIVRREAEYVVDAAPGTARAE